ncbi:MAG: hypothetical protein U9R15_10865 [Chloroflexota bacterium]|nr:hypothetical protein [Chloroflexota bacterium]
MGEEVSHGKQLGERLREKTIAILDEHETEPFSDDAQKEIDYILARPAK